MSDPMKKHIERKIKRKCLVCGTGINVTLRGKKYSGAHYFGKLRLPDKYLRLKSRSILAKSEAFRSLKELRSLQICTNGSKIYVLKDGVLNPFDAINHL